MTVGDVARVNLLQAFKGNRVITGFNIRMATSAGTLGDLASDVVSSILPSFIPAVTQDLGVIAVEVQDVVPGVAETVEHTITGNLVGEFVSPSAPPQVAACLSIHCGIKSKRARGRMFVSGLPAEFVIAGTISGQLATNLQTFGNTLITRYGPTGNNAAYRLVVHSPADPAFVNKKGVHTRTTVLTTQATLVTLDLVARTQRRRELGVGA
jgi:hypothetical protein